MQNKNLLSFSSRFDPILFENLPKHLNFLKKIKNNWSGPPDGLIRFIDEFKKNEGMESEIDVLEVFKVLLSEKVNNFPPWILESYKILTLRELFYLAYGSLIAFSPFSLSWIRADKTILHADTGFRISLYRDGDYHFAEYDVNGWLSAPNGYIFPFTDASHICANFNNHTRWPFDPKHKLLIDSIAELYKDSNTVSGSDIKIATLTQTNENLGHFLWNKMSGVLSIIDLFKNTTRALSLLVNEVQLDKKSKFSDINLAMVSIDLAKTMGLADRCRIEIVKSSSDSLSPRFLTNSIFSKLSMLSLDKKTLKVYCDFFEKKILTLNVTDLSIGDLSKINIFMNIRCHNKSLSNIEECIEVLLNKLPQTLYPKLFFILEGMSDSADLLSKLSLIFDKNNISNTAIKNTNQFLLYWYLKNSDICIVPVGSGLVMPTWLFDDKTCITYADHSHMNQLNWWSNVVPHNPKIIKFKLEEIIHTHNRTGRKNTFYSDFEIDKDMFANLVSEEILKSVNGAVLPVIN